MNRMHCDGCDRVFGWLEPHYRIDKGGMAAFELGGPRDWCAKCMRIAREAIKARRAHVTPGCDHELCGGDGGTCPGCGYNPFEVTP